ncbi:hypothetical protein PF003_g17091 [Phytophthora fragariae]|nr:hypothetical protein PF003_g17091 [Phytophthora fragariae]
MKPSTAHVLPDMYAVLSFVKCDKKSHVGAKTRVRPARLLERLRHHRSSAERRLYEPRTAHVLPDMYAVLSFVKSDKKSHVGAKTRSRPARLLERLRHHRSSANRRQYEAQHCARVTGHVVRGAELREERQEVACRGEDQVKASATTGAASTPPE